MATREQVEKIVRRWIEEGWENGDPSVVDRLHAPDFVDHDPGGRSPDNRGFKHGIEALFTAFSDFSATVEEIVVDEDLQRASVRWSAAATHTGSYLGAEPTGRGISFKGIEIVRIVDGRITERWGEWDGMDLLVQLGQWQP